MISRRPWGFFVDELTGESQLEPGAPVHFGLEQELTGGDWSGLREDFEA